MSLKLDKRMLLVLAVFLMLVIIPTAFAEDVSDADAVGVDDNSAVDEVSESAVDDVQLSTSDNSSSAVVSVSEVEKIGAADESDVLNVGSSEIEIKPNTATVDDYSPGTSNVVIFVINQGSGVTYSSDLWSCQDNFLLYVNNQNPVDTNIAPSTYSDVSTGSIQVNLNIVPSTYWTSGANSVKLGLSSDDTSMLEGLGDTVTLTPMTVNVAGSGPNPGPDPEDDSIWVNDATGDDTNGNGTKDNPYKTISKGITAASAGGTVKIAEGNYVLTSAITISKNIAIVGVGSVNITRNGGYLFSKDNSFKGTISFTGITFRDVISSSDDAIWYDHSGTSYKGDLKFINCSFINNRGYALISATDNVLLEGCAFINNTATGTGSSTRSAIVFKYNGQNAVITVTNSIFINNKMTTSYKYLFNDYSNGATLVTTDSYWGSNDKPNFADIFNHGTSSTTLNSWAVIDTEIDDDVCVGDSPTLTIRFKSNSTGAQSLSEISGTMPNLTVSLTPTLGSVDSTTVTISNNVGTTTYTATAEGQETVTIKEGSQDLATATFYVDESPVGKLFVDASYAGGDSDGSKAKPYTSISDALDNLGTNTQIVVKKGNYELNNYAINSDVLIRGKDDDVIITTATNHMTIASGVTVNLTNLIFKDATSASIVSSGVLNITDCVFEDNSGTNVISSTAGSVDIAYTVFNNNEVTDKIVDAIAGTVDYNFWGSNAQPTIATALTLNNYVIVNATIPTMRENDELESEITHDINIKFLLNDGVTELGKSLHNVTVSLTSTIGAVTDSVTIADNEAVAQFSSNDEGQGQIVIKTGEVTLKTFDFTVIERETGRIFVDDSVAVTGDGSKANPYKTVQEAIADNNNDGGKEIIVYSGTYKVYNTVISKDVTITGRGNVIFDVYDYTNDEGRFFAGYTSSTNHYLNVSNIIFINSGKQYVLQYAKDIVVDNCTFANGSGSGGIIQPTSSYSVPGSVVIKNSAFINLTCGSTPIGNSYATTTVTNSVFNNVAYSSTYLIQGSVGDINGNFWGTNAPTKLASSYTLNNWAVVVPSLDETIVQGQTKTLTVQFKNTTNGETFTDLNTVLPNVTLGLTSLLGNTFTPETVTISDNIGTVTYNAIENGIEQINLTSGDKTIETLERTIEEGDSPDKIFVDETYTGADSDGSKDKPFNNLKDAFDAITATRNNVVVLEGDYSISNYTLSNDATIRWSKKRVNITATDLKIDSDVNIENIVFIGGNAIIVKNGAKLSVVNSTFVNRTGGFVSAGDLTISESQFINITRNVIVATDGTVNVEFSEFILSDDIGCADTVTGNMNNNYFDESVPQNIGGVTLDNYIVLVITPNQNDIDLNASEKQTFTIAFKNTTNGIDFTDLSKEIPALDIAIVPSIGSVDKSIITLSDSDSFTYDATTEGTETINFTTEGLTFKTLEFDVGKSVAGKIFVNQSYAGGASDGSRLKPYTDIASAISAAQSGNEIVIYEGTYTTNDPYTGGYYKTLTFTGVGNVVLTRTAASGSYTQGQLFSMTSGQKYTFNNIIFANVNANNAYYDYGSIFYIYSSESVELNLINCTFENNTGKSGVIYQTNSYSYADINIQGTKFINNTASARNLIYYYGGSGYKLTISNSVFIDNSYTNAVIYNRGSSYATINLNNNFWGSNELPSDVTSNTGTLPTTWVIVSAAEVGTLNQGETANIKLTFNSTDGTTVSELDKVMPDTTLNVESVLNAVDATVTLSDNAAEITYTAVNYGDEAITVKAGENVLATISFIVEEIDDGTKIFVDSSSTSTETPDGSKAKPYTNLKDALDAVNSTRKLISIAEGDDYVIDGYTIASDVEIYANKPVTIKATGLTVGADVTFKNLIFKDGNAITVNAGKKLSIYDSTFIGNDGAIESSGDLVINATKFIDNTAIDGKGIINALAGSIKVSYSEFIGSTGGTVIVYEADGVTTDVDNNYWSDNTATDVSTIAPATWIKLVPTVGTVNMGKQSEIAFKFVNNDGSELDVILPTVDIALTSDIGTVDSIVTIENNAGTANYISDVEGSETISYGKDTLTFEVSEDETGKLFVAPEDYERNATAALGSKANPYTTLTLALSAATAGTEIIMLEGTYTTSGYYTVNKNNLKITGRGKVVLTSSSTSNYYFINAAGSSTYSAGYSLTLTNLVFENITVASNYNNQFGLIYYKGYGSYYGTPDYRDLTVIDCTFNNNNAYYGVIYTSGYASLNVTGSTFTNNTATGGSFIYAYSNMQSFNLNYNIFVDNKYYGSYGAIRGPSNGNIDYNFWGSNNKPVSYKDYGSISTVNNWVVANITIDNDDLAVGDSATVTVKFQYTTDGETFIDLEKSMPTYTFDLTKLLGEIPQNVTVENNAAQFTYNAVAQGDEIISLELGNTEVANLTFYVDESPIGKIFVDADADENGDGSRKTPFKTIAEAIAKNAEVGGNQTIVIKAGEYTLSNAEVSDNLTIKADDGVMIFAEGQTALTVKNNANVTLINVNINDAKDAIVAEENTKLDIINSTFIGNNGAIVSNGTTTVYRTLFQDNSVAIKAEKGNLDVSYSAFIKNNVLIESAIAATANNNFWGTNAQPAITNVETNTWVILNVTFAEAPDIFTETNYNIELKFLDNNENALADTIPDVEFTITVTNGSAESTNIISENNAVATYIINVEGSDEIAINVADETLATIDVTAIENQANRIYVAPESYSRDSSATNGTKENPYYNLADALAENVNRGGNQEIIVFEGTYSTTSTYNIGANVAITGRGNVVLTGTLSSYLFSTGSNTLNLTNIVIDGVSTTSYLIYSYGSYSTLGGVNIDNCTIINNKMNYLVYAYYANAVIKNTNIINNTAGYYLFYGYTYGSSYGTTTINYCNIFDNEYSGYYMVYAYGDANYNYWGINAELSGDLPNVYSGCNRENWVILVPSISSDTLYVGDEYELTNVFILNTGDLLGEALPSLTINVNSQLGNADPIVTSYDVGTTAFTVTDEGDGTIEFYIGDNKVGELSITSIKPLYVSVEKINEGEKLNITVTLLTKDNGTATVTINNVDYAIELIDGVGSEVKETNLLPGTYDVEVTFGNYTNTNTTTINLRDANITFDIADVEVGQKATIKLIVNPTMTSDIIVYVNGKEYTATKDNNYTFETEVLNVAGEQSVVAFFTGDAYHAADRNSTTFNVTKLEPVMTIDDIAGPVYVGDDVTITVNIADVTGGITIKVNDEEYYVAIKEGKAVLTVNTLVEGVNNITAIFEGNEKYTLATANTTVTALAKEEPADAEINITDEGIELPDDATGNVTIKVDGREVYNGPAKETPALDLPAGDHIVEVIYSGDENYSACDETKEVNVPKSNTTITADPIEFTEGESATLIVNVDANAKGTVFVDIEGNKFYAEIDAGVANVAIFGLTAGEYTAHVTYDGDNEFNGNSTDVAVKVNAKEVPVVPVDANMNITLSDDNSTVSVELPSDATGSVVVKVDGREVYSGLANETSSVSLGDLAAGSHVVEVRYSGDANYTADELSEEFTISKEEPFVPVPVDANMNVTLSDDNSTVSVELPSDATGSVVVKVDGREVYSGLANETSSVSLGDLADGSHVVEVRYSGDANYTADEFSTEFTIPAVEPVPKPDAEINVTDEGIELPDDATGNMTIKVDGREVYNGPVNETPALDLPAGDHIVEVIYSGDENYSACDVTKEVNVPKLDTTISGNSIEFTEGESGTITVTVDPNAKGIITVSVAGKKFYGELDEGVANVTVYGLAPEEYLAQIIYDGDEFFNGNSTSVAVKVNAIPEPVEPVDGDVNITTPSEIDPSGNSTVTVELPADAGGNVSLIVDGNEVKSVPVANGTATLPLDALSEGAHVVEVKYSGDDKYASASSVSAVVVPKSTIEPIVPTINVTAPSEITVGETTKIVVTLPNGTTGYVLLDVDNKGYYASVVNGTATFEISGLTAGIKNINCTYSGDDKYSNASGNATINVLYEVKITNNKDINMLYRDGTKYTVRVYGTDGKAVGAGEIVTFKINGKTIKVKTDKNGYASLKITNVPKKYTITATYKTAQVKNKVVVKQILKSKNVKVKKSAKKLVLKASLKKVKGKYLKGKKITFKFKGKKYKAKTNKKGVAKVTIKKKVIKKLKKGKKYKVKITYLKTSITKKVTVKK